MDQRYAVFRALGDPTRYAIHAELLRAGRPLSTAEVAEALDLHANTVRPHLERLREVGLVEHDTDSRGTVGRPQHRWSPVAEAPSLGLEPPSHTMLSTLLAGAAAEAGIDPETLAATGRQRGRVAADEQADDPGSSLRRAGCIAGLEAELTELGFEPVRSREGAGGTHEVAVCFSHCPYADLAEAFPSVICHLHRGIVEGFVERAGGAVVTAFNTLDDRDPCRVVLAENA